MSRVKIILVKVTGYTTFWKGLKVYLANERITSSGDCATAAGTGLSKTSGLDVRICRLYTGLIVTPI